MEEKKKLSPFDYSKSVLNGDAPMAMSSEYVPFLVNRAVAHHRDCIFICQLLNEYQVTPEQHYSFLFNQVPKYKRSFEAWVSKKGQGESFDDLMLLSKYYSCSLATAQEYLSLMTPEKIDLLRTVYGGTRSEQTKKLGESPTNV